LSRHSFDTEWFIKAEILAPDIPEGKA
jgi:hypothetical protein